MTGKDPKKFDPARAHVLDAPERERYVPTDDVLYDDAGEGLPSARRRGPEASSVAHHLPCHFALTATPIP